MIEPLLFGIVLGFIPVTLAGLFVAAYLQYQLGNQLELQKIVQFEFFKLYNLIELVYKILPA